ncbi:hypothetical protein [Pectobacterium sp. B1J-3]|uniref:hypothetical protein n=1 Tax=Pectobacterium sp. B1J-3 TaxID=3385371 RepID=UPI00390627BE
MAILSPLLQDQITVIGTSLIIALVVVLYLAFRNTVQLLWQKSTPLEGKIIHRYRQPAQKSLMLIDNVYGYVPLHTWENERFILNVEAGGQRYEVETSETEYQTLSIGDRITVYHRPDNIL